MESHFWASRIYSFLATVERDRIRHGVCVCVCTMRPVEYHIIINTTVFLSLYFVVPAARGTYSSEFSEHKSSQCCVYMCVRVCLWPSSSSFSLCVMCAADVPCHTHGVCVSSVVLCARAICRVWMFASVSRDRRKSLCRVAHSPRRSRSRSI